MSLKEIPNYIGCIDVGEGTAKGRVQRSAGPGVPAALKRVQRYFDILITVQPGFLCDHRVGVTYARCGITTIALSPSAYPKMDGWDIVFHAIIRYGRIIRSMEDDY